LKGNGNGDGNGCWGAAMQYVGWFIIVNVTNCAIRKQRKVKRKRKLETV